MTSVEFLAAMDDIVQFTMSRIIVSLKFLGDLQNYTFLESLEPTEPEKYCLHFF